MAHPPDLSRVRPEKWAGLMESLPPPEDTEALIVGAGPAGCTAGMLLASQGMRVVILEKEAPGHHKVCGDLLGPRSLWLLNDLGLGAVRWDGGGTPVSSIRVSDETGMRSWARFSAGGDGEAPALTVRRDLFDGFLQKAAGEAGCRISYGVGFRSLVGRHGGYVWCRAEHRGAERLFRARILIGADGFNSAVAGAAGLGGNNLGKRILAVRGYFRNVDGLRESMELYFLKKVLPGYAWVIPVGGRTANIGLGVRADVCVRRRLNLTRELRRFVGEQPGLASRMRNAEPVEAIRGWQIGTYDPKRQRSAPRLLLLGDAACLADPLTGEGVFGAMKSALLAVPVLREAFSSGDFSRAKLVEYDRAVAAYFDRAYRFTGFLSSLPSDHRLLQPLVLWGLKRVQAHSVMDPGYAAMVGGFFTGMLPRKRMWNRKWFRKTFWG